MRPLAIAAITLGLGLLGVALVAPARPHAAATPTRTLDALPAQSGHTVQRSRRATTLDVLPDVGGGNVQGAEITVPATTVPAVTVPVVTAPGGRELSAGERVAWFGLARLGVPYVFGAAGPDAYDCSGLTRAAYRRVGVDLPHHAAWQATLGREVDVADVRAGDLVFTAGGRPRHDLGHVGIAIDDDEWVHAPAPGRAVERAPIPFDRVQRVRRYVP